jgi:hypothetical protein
VKQQFRGVTSRKDAEAKRDALRALTGIDIREVLVGESDVDIVTKHDLGLSAARYQVKKIDRVDAARFDPASKAGRDEENQGYLPVEENPSRQERLHSLGRLRRRHQGNLTMGASPSIFPRRRNLPRPSTRRATKTTRCFTRFAFCWQASTNYFHEHGLAYPDERQLLRELDPESLKAAQKSDRGRASQSTGSSTST